MKCYISECVKCYGLGLFGIHWFIISYFCKVNQISSISLAAERLWNAEQDKKVCNPIREFIEASDIESAYEIQKIITQKKIEQGEKICGYKVGLTSLAVQKQLGVDQPDFGVLWQSKEINNHGSVKINELMQPKAEAEIAFILSRDIHELPIDHTDFLKKYVSHIAPSIELVGSRISNWDIRIADTVADNASASHFILGNPLEDLANFDFVGCKMQLKKNNEIASEGIGAACMGNPIDAALWLIQTLLNSGTIIEKGSVILSGALGPMVPCEVGDNFEAQIEGLSNVSFTIN